MFLKNLKIALFALFLPLSSHAGLIDISSATVTSSSQYGSSPSDYHHSNVVDGVLPVFYTDKNYWNAGTLAGSLTIDLGDVYTIDKIELLITTGNNFNMLLGDGVSSSSLTNSTQMTDPYAAPGSAAHNWKWYDVNPDFSLNGQFLTYSVVGGGHWAHLGEIKVYGELYNPTNSTPIPEPSMAALFVFGLLSVGFFSRRKK